MKKMIPVVKWAGGKRWLIPEIHKLWNHKYARYIEPFAGGMAVALDLSPKVALINDINPHLINLYKWIQKGLIVDLPMKNEKEFYYVYRKKFNEEKGETREKALLFYYLNRTCYNGLCRFNKQGKFNVPFGRYKVINYRSDFLDYQSLFKDWIFTCSDFETIVSDKKDFIYVDPPYDVPFTQYSKEGFTWDDQIRLAKWAKNQKGYVVMSNQATSRICSLYDSFGFKLKILKAPRLISCKGNRVKAKEVLAIKEVG